MLPLSGWSPQLRGAGLAPEVPRRLANRRVVVRLPAAHEVTPADTVEVTACGENRLPAAGKHTPPGVIPALQAHITGGEERAAAHKER